MGAAAKEHAPLLAGMLKDPDTHVRLAAVWALGAMGEAHPEQIPSLVDLLKGPDADRHTADEAFFMGTLPRSTRLSSSAFWRAETRTSAARQGKSSRSWPLCLFST